MIYDSDSKLLREAYSTMNGAVSSPVVEEEGSASDWLTSPGVSNALSKIRTPQPVSFEKETIETLHEMAGEIGDNLIIKINELVDNASDHVPDEATRKHIKGTMISTIQDKLREEYNLVTAEPQEPGDDGQDYGPMPRKRQHDPFSISKISSTPLRNT